MKYRVRLKPWNVFLSTYVHLPGDLKFRLATQVSTFNLRQPASPIWPEPKAPIIWSRVSVTRDNFIEHFYVKTYSL